MRSILLCAVCAICIGCGQASPVARNHGSEVVASRAVPSSPNVLEAQLVHGGVGFAWTDVGLFLTKDSGTSWDRLAPPGTLPAEVAGIHVVSASRASLVIAQGDRIFVTMTDDGGTTWRRSPLAALPRHGASYGRGSLSFADNQNGWLDIDLGSNANFSYGQVFRTGDGGATWTSVGPAIAGTISAGSATEAWIVGGVGNGHITTTQDGGTTWSQAAVPLVKESLPGYWVFSREAQADPVRPFLRAVRRRNGDGQITEVGVLTTADRGRSWTLASHFGGIQADRGDVPGAIIDSSNWQFVLSDRSGAARLSTSHDAGRTWTDTRAAGLPPNSVVSISTGSQKTFWARVSFSGCAAVKENCYSVQELFRSLDGGANWVQLKTP